MSPDAGRQVSGEVFFDLASCFAPLVPLNDPLTTQTTAAGDTGFTFPPSLSSFTLSFTSSVMWLTLQYGVTGISYYIFLSYKNLHKFTELGN